MTNDIQNSPSGALSRGTKAPHVSDAPTGKVRDRGATEERLLEAAKRIFASRGYDAASVRDIAEEADANVSLINRYFGNKDGLLVVITERFIHRKQRGVLSYPPQSNLRDEIYGYLRHRLQEYMNDEAMVRLMVSRIAIDSDFQTRALESFDTNADQNFRDRVQKLIDNGALRETVDVDALFATTSYFSFSTNFFGAIIQRQTDAQIDKLFQNFADMASEAYVCCKTASTVD